MVWGRKEDRGRFLSAGWTTTWATFIVVARIRLRQVSDLCEIRCPGAILNVTRQEIVPTPEIMAAVHRFRLGFLEGWVYDSDDHSDRYGIRVSDIRLTSSSIFEVCKAWTGLDWRVGQLLRGGSGFWEAETLCKRFQGWHVLTLFIWAWWTQISRILVLVILINFRWLVYVCLQL